MGYEDYRRIVKYILDLKGRGVSCSQIAQELNVLGFKPIRGGKWYRKLVTYYARQ